MRKYEQLDPNDRSVNSPTIIAAATRVLAIWNQANPNDKMEKITQKVKDWYISDAKKAGWDKADFAGNECILVKKFS